MGTRETLGASPTWFHSDCGGNPRDAEYSPTWFPLVVARTRETRSVSPTWFPTGCGGDPRDAGCFTYLVPHWLWSDLYDIRKGDSLLTLFLNIFLSQCLNLLNYSKPSVVRLLYWTVIAINVTAALRLSGNTVDPLFFGHLICSSDVQISENYPIVEFLLVCYKRLCTVAFGIHSWAFNVLREKVFYVVFYLSIFL